MNSPVTNAQDPLSPDGLPRLKDVIAGLKLSARKHLGQNYILDFNLLRKIASLGVDSLGADSGQAGIIEIGPGPGGLTRALLMTPAAHVLSIEKDRRFDPVLAAIQAHYPDRFSYMVNDALELDVLALARQMPVATRGIIANLPYNIASALIVRWLTHEQWPPPVAGMIVMVQKEVAHRLTASAGTKAYGRLSVLAQWRCKIDILMTLPRQCFTPPPKVTSALVRLRPIMSEHAPKLKTIETITRAAFGQRRKMLRRALANIAAGANIATNARGTNEIEVILRKADIHPDRRAETVSVDEYLKLARILEHGILLQ